MQSKADFFCIIAQVGAEPIRQAGVEAVAHAAIALVGAASGDAIWLQTE